MLLDHERVLRISDHGSISSGAASLTSDLSMSLSSARSIKCKEQNCSTIAALLERAILSGEIIQRISADNERFKFTRPFQQVLSALILFCGLASINHPVLVMLSTRGPSLASKEIDRKNVCKRETT